MQQQNQQNQQSQQGGQQQQNPPQGPPPNGQDYNLSNVLHFLQTEWRHYERDRNEWEIERAEMRARIALLEGERRSFENVKLDLMRRIKMLEYALRMERSKQLNQPSSAIPPQKAASLQGQSGKEEGSHKEGSGNSSPRSEDSPLPGTGENRLSIGSLSGLPNGAGPNMTSSASAVGPVSALAAAAGANTNARPQTWAGVPNGAVLPAALTKPPPGRDAKGRARSRDFLKQCLQEVNYLTSSAALNPLPNRPILTAAVAAQPPQQPLQHAQALLAAQQQQGGGSSLASGTGMPLSLPNLPSFDQQQQQQAGFGAPANGASGLNSTLSGFNGRPRKVVPEVGKDFPTLNGIGSAAPNISVPQQAAGGGQNATLASEPPNIPPPNPALLNADRDKDRAGPRVGSPNSAVLQPLATEGSEPGLSLERQFSKQSEDQGSSSTGDSESSQITAIFRPDAAGEWKERLRAAAEAVERAKAEEELAALSTSGSIKDEDDDSVSDDGDTVVGDDKLWKPRRTLRNHLDAVRALAFHPSEMCLVTGGDDFTIKIWRMDANDLLSNSSQGTEIEPQVTLRGHSSSVTRLLISGSRNLLYSASLDSTIRVWTIPSQGQPTYAPFDAARAKGVLVGHTDAVWDLALLRDDTLLVSGGSDGSVKVWDTSLPSTPLKLSWGYNGVDGEAETSLGITSLDGIKTDLKKVAVAFSNAVVKMFDVETGAEVGKLESDVTYDGTPATQINRIASHPTMSILVTAHEDKYIRLFDIATGACTYSMLAHTDGVTSLSIDVAGFSLVSGGHDCSIRFWDIMGNKVCLQEITNHRKKADEGVLDVEYCPSLPILASAGADGIVKLYASS
ncbi:hypothetical protein M407DRAFT_18357 [Tulasnella calospora MUT 4182]|uniref:Striatin N-terminal domain-containing protein n=1 Tax=Tulasnella calospora MUT 4182 TaxID=1051891 RepID=A0A0C3LG22_9AGAM|nr:hypothetical protein M407DRAFT_18357 [Tulasnella calospora MUT 4182]